MPRGRSGDAGERSAAGGGHRDPTLFRGRNLWLRRALGTGGAADTEPVALEITALLQGAMLQAVILGDVATFDAATRKLGELSG